MKYGIIYIQDLFEATDKGHDPYVETFDFEGLKKRLHEDYYDPAFKIGTVDFKSCRSLSEVNEMIMSIVPDVVAVEID